MNPNSTQYRYLSYLTNLKISQLIADMDRVIVDLSQQDNDTARDLLDTLITFRLALDNGSPSTMDRTSTQHRALAYLMHLKINQLIADMDRVIVGLSQQDTDPVRDLLDTLHGTDFNFVETYTQGNESAAPATLIRTRKVISPFY